MSKIKLVVGVLLVGGATVAVGKCIYDKVVENKKAKNDAVDKMFSDETIGEICDDVVQAMKDVGDEYNRKLKDSFDKLRNTTKETAEEAVETAEDIVNEVEQKVEEDIPEDINDGITNESPEEKTEEESFTKAVDDAKEAFKEALNEESEQ